MVNVRDPAGPLSLYDPRKLHRHSDHITHRFRCRTNSKLEGRDWSGDPTSGSLVPAHRHTITHMTWTCSLRTPLYLVTIIYQDILQGVPGFATDCLCGVGCCGLTTPVGGSVGGWGVVGGSWAGVGGWGHITQVGALLHSHLACLHAMWLSDTMRG